LLASFLGILVIVISLPPLISVLVPAFNCADLLESHSESLGFLRRQNIPIIWVVSPSSDKSEVVAKRIADSVGDLFYCSPDGLYHSWNFGIDKVKTLFFCISTIGDYYINDGILKMLDLLVRNNADITSRSQSVKSWPVHRFRKKLARFSDSVIPTDFLVSLQFRSGLDNLLGSWASIVARTATMNKQPFPTDYGNYGDTAWSFLNLPHLRFVFHNDEVSRFRFHYTPNYFPNAQHQIHYRVLARRMLHINAKLASGVNSFSLAWKKHLVFRYLLNKSRGIKPRRFWWLHIRNWRLRYLRDFYATFFLIHFSSAHYFQMHGTSKPR
jgi:glycosyltransferase involved in cell wall biosynthesis